jgi:hypothetical protein
MEVAVVTGGVGVHVSLAGSQPVGAGDVILLRPGVWHGYRDLRIAHRHAGVGYPRLRPEDFHEVADVIATALHPGFDDAVGADLRGRVAKLADRHPLYVRR